jgi:hypothetical protein
MKRKALAAALFFLLMSGQAFAAWTDEFTENFDKFGFDVAVENALANDVTPQAILDYVLKNREKFSEQLTMKALYCAGVDVDVVDRAASALGIEPQDIKASLQQSIEECGSKVALTDRDILDTEMPPGDSGLPGTPPAGTETPVEPPPVAVNTGGATGGGSGTSSSSSGSSAPPIVPPPPPPPVSPSTPIL